MSYNQSPAKRFLLRYSGISGQIDAICDAIKSTMDRATNISAFVKDINIKTSPVENDRMAADVCKAIDASSILYDYKTKAEAALQEILEAIASVNDEKLKELLIRRYVSNETFEEIQIHMHYESSHIFAMHKKALDEIEKWMCETGKMQDY